MCLHIEDNRVSRKSYAVYRVMKNGTLLYVPRSMTHCEKLAKEIAEERSRGEITMPDGTIKKVDAHPHVHKEFMS